MQYSQSIYYTYKSHDQYCMLDFYRKKIIELIDLQQSEDGDIPYTVEKTRRHLVNNTKGKGHDPQVSHGNGPSNWNINNNNPLDLRGLELDYQVNSLAETDERKEQMSPRSRDLRSRSQRSKSVGERLNHVTEYEMDSLEAYVDRVLESKEHFDTVEEFDRY